MKWKNSTEKISVCEWEIFCKSDFMNKERIKQECQCVKKSTCLAIADLLVKKNLNEAFNLIDLNFK